MRLHELYTLRQLPVQAPETMPDSGLDDFVEKLERHGFKSLGTGAFGTVFTNTSLGYAIKLFGFHDDGYRTFLSYVVANPGNPHLPKLRGKMKRINSSFAACRMEFLSRLNPYEKDLINQVKRYAWSAESADEMKQEFHDAGHVIDASFIDTVYDLYKISERRRLVWDLHGNNVMKRGDVLVITDPFCS